MSSLAYNGNHFSSLPVLYHNKNQGRSQDFKKGGGKNTWTIINEQREESDSKSDGMIEEAAVAVTTSL